jgi:hypothetical protein
MQFCRLQGRIVDIESLVPDAEISPVDWNGRDARRTPGLSVDDWFEARPQN